MSTYTDLVKSKIYFLSKDELNKFAIEKHLIDKQTTKTSIINLIINNLSEELSKEIIERFNHTIALTPSEIEKKLNISRSERLKFTKKNLLTVTGSYTARAYGQDLETPLYDAIQAFNLTDDDINFFRSQFKKVSEKQLAALEKARAKSLELRTCKECNHVVGKKSDLKNGVCAYCLEIADLKRETAEAIAERKEWLKNKEKYVILDTETTGLEYDAEIVEIGIIDLDGNELFSSLITPLGDIPEEASNIHGITLDTLKAANAPTWEDISNKIISILKDKIIIAFNSSFDIRLIHQTCKKWNIIEFCELKHVCLMHNVMKEYNSDRYISLKDALGVYMQSHRAVDDCLMCLEIIKR